LSDSWPARVASALGPPGAVLALGGGAWRVQVGDRDVVVKVGEGALDEAEGLRHLGRIAGAPPVPEVVIAEPDLLVTSFVSQTARTAAHEEALGRMLAALHSAAWPEWGGGSSFIGTCRVEPVVAADPVAFYEGRLLALARRCGLEDAVRAATARLGDRLPPGGPALLHGDLWWGNVLWGSDGRPWLIDPSVHGGYPEEDLAMLALFSPAPDRVVRAYGEVRALDPGWEDRVPLFQLYPLLVHSVLFGAGYRSRAAAVARRLG
jgi:fructosamine-3-kinase